MSLSKRIREILALAKGRKVTERRLAVDNLFSLYRNASIVAEITSNSKNNLPDSVSWDEILHGVHSIVLNEGNRTAVSKSIKDKENVAELFLQTVVHANNLLNSFDLMSFFFQVIGSKTYSFGHATYMSVLSCYILSIEMHRNNISGQQWQDLLSTCIDCYRDQDSPVRKDKVLDTIQMIVLYGCSLSHLLFKIRKLLPFTGQVLKYVKSNDALADSALKLANTICREIATESRFLLCSFGETIVPECITLRKCDEKYKLLLIFVQVHHPQGALMDDVLFHALNVSAWKSILYDICSMIIQESSSHVLSGSFIELGCEVFRQILDNPLASEKIKRQIEIKYTETSGKKRMLRETGTMIDMIGNCGPEGAWPLLQIFARLLRKYPKSIDTEGITLFLQNVSLLLMQSSSLPKIVETLCELGIALVDVEQQNDPQGISGNNKLYWTEIFDTVTSYLNTNHNQEVGHRFLQYLIENSKIMNSSSLLKSYVMKTMCWSPHSIKSLLFVCKHNAFHTNQTELNSNLISTHKNSLVSKLLQWISNMPWKKLVTLNYIKNLSKLLIGLNLRLWRKDFETISKKYTDLVNFELTYNPDDILEIEKYYLAMEFHINIFKGLSTLYNEKIVRQDPRKKENLPLLFSNVIEILKMTEKTKDTKIFIVKCALIAQIISDLREVVTFNIDLQDCALIQIFKEFLYSIFHELAQSDLEKVRPKDLIYVMKLLRVLFQVSTDREVNEIIVNSISLQALQNIYSFVRIYQDRDTIKKMQVLQSNVDMDFSCKDELIEQADKEAAIMSVVKTLTLYCCMTTGDTLMDTQEQLLCILLDKDRYHLSSHIDTEMILLILENISLCTSNMFTKTSIEAIMNLLTELSRHSYKRHTVVRRILCLTPRFFKTAVELNQNVSNIVKMIVYFHNLLQERNNGVQKSCGPSLYLIFLKCLEQFIFLDPFFQFMNYTKNDNEDVPIIEFLLEYINSPFYTIRLQSACCIFKAFKSQDIEYGWKVSFFENIKTVLRNAFTINGKLDIDEKPDERMMRVSSSLYIIAAVIHGSDILKCQALFFLTHLVMQKQIEAKSVRKVLKFIACEKGNLVENNLDYLLMRWWHDQNSFEKFPWELTDCSTEEIFYVKYMHILISVLMQTGNISKAMELCNQRGLSFEQEFQESFSSVIVCLLSKVSNASDLIDAKIENIFRNLKANQVEFKSVRIFNDLVHDNLDKIIILLIREINDEKHFSEVFGLRVTFPESGFVRLTTNVVDQCFQFMQIHFFSAENLIFYLADKRCDVLQKVLLKLTRNVYETFGASKLRSFHQYVYFCNVIAEKIKTVQLYEISHFIIRDICYTLLYQIDGNNDQFAELVCKYLYIFLQCILPEKSSAIKEIFAFHMKILTKRVCRDKNSSALQSLRFLVLTQKDLFTESIANSDFFPNTDIFKEMTEIHNKLRYNNTESHSLTAEIKHFLKISSDKYFNRTESIVRLRDQLSLKRRELKEHFHNLEELRGFAEDCISSQIHRLVYQLVKLMVSSDPQISQEAAKCLGLIGPGNLATMILHPGKIIRRKVLNKFEMLTHRILTLLSDLIIEKNIEIRDASANALYVVLSSFWGRNLMGQNYLDDFEHDMDITELRLVVDNIRPFLFENKKSAPMDCVDLEICPNLQEKAWIECASGLYSEWIKKFSCIIAHCFKKFYMDSIIPILDLSVDFCEQYLPWMVYILFEDPRLINEMSTHISKFFQYHFAPPNYDFTPFSSLAVHKNPNCTHESVHCMLNIVNFIWVQTDKTVRLNFDYLSIAQAAQFCSAYFTSVLCAELWCESFLNGNRDVDSMTIIDYITDHEPVKGKMLQDIIREANVKIGDPDAIHGCRFTHLIDPASRIRYYEDLKQWDKSMLMHDIELSCGIDTTEELLHAFQQMGLYFLLNDFASWSKDEEKTNYNIDYKFECAWRLGDWSLPESMQTTHVLQSNDCSSIYVESESYHYYHYKALKCLNDKDKVGLTCALDNARNCVIKYLRHISLESCKAMYPMLCQLQMLREIEEWVSTDPSDYNERFLNWQYHDYINNNDFEYLESVLSQRISMFKISQSHGKAEIVHDALIDSYLKLIQFAKERGHFRVATRALDSLAKADNLSYAIKNKLCYLEAHLAWSQNDRHIGQFLLNLLVKNSSIDSSLRAQALCIFGDWIGKTESVNPHVIIRDYYQESIKTFMSIGQLEADDLKNLYETQATLAQFSDMQYRQITEYIMSPQFKIIKSFAEMPHVSINSVDSRDNDLRKAIYVQQRQSKNDVAELKSFEKDRNFYLSLAIEYYLTTLTHSKDHDFLVFRVVSLWQDNIHHSNFNKILGGHLPKIASFKFIPLIPQLAPHMNVTHDEFSLKINKILKICAIEHPHHTLPVLLALKNSTSDFTFSENQATNKEETKPRVEAAIKLIGQLQKTTIGPVIKEMIQLSRSLVELAYLKSPKKRTNEKHVIPSNQAICKVKNLNNCIVPTLTLCVRENGNYENIIGVRKYKNNFETVGGMNAPKKIECIGTDGIIRRQLVKGQDDMRQDAVMQQVFTVINSLLRANKETKTRKLDIRTYKVVPLTQRAGILEWCENTVPIANILLGSDRNSGIHKKYYPENFTGLECRKKMEAVSRESNEVKLQTFLECCKNMHPAFHHFFTENYLSPEVWFERRLTYTRSVATNSIVGYILSVGDRHLQNILIDQTTAEVIHIDFGIAFEQGKLLSMPETVPFRLTRDIEVPMGVLGVEGVMRSCCEQTLRLLEEQREIIITLLRVLLYDPLFSWSISPTKTDRLLGSSGTESFNNSHGSLEINKFANRALLRVHQKLQGVEESVSLSVPGHVERLLQQARDPSNLCLLFHGWQAYL